MNSNVASLLPPDWIWREPSELARLSPLVQLAWPPFVERGLRLSVKREDMLDSKLGGNKLYKLYGHFHEARRLQAIKNNSGLGKGEVKTLKLASFGGAWSNHIYALAALGESLGIETLGVIRGEEPKRASAMLEDAREMGMQLIFVSRAEYAEFTRSEASITKREAAAIKLQKRYGDYYWIPEGGGGSAGARYCGAMLDGILSQAVIPVDAVAHACGTGASLAGIIARAPAHIQVEGIAVLRGGSSIDKSVQAALAVLGGAKSRWCVQREFHCGGYAKLPEYLVEFIYRFEAGTGLQLEPVYTAKLMYGLTALAERNYWPEGTHLVAIHSGGMQGRRGMAIRDINVRDIHENAEPLT